MKMHCPECGMEVTKEAKFCPKCGVKIDVSKVKDPDVSDIAEKLKNGTEDEKSVAFTELYGTTYKTVFGHVFGKTGNQDTTDDIVQEVYTTVWAKIGQLRDTKAFYGWFWQIVDSKCNEKGRRTKKDADNLFTQVISDDEGNELDVLDSVFDDTLPLPEDALANEEIKELLFGAINSLPADQKHVIYGFYYGEKSIESLAEEMGSTANTVKSWLRRGRAAMYKSVSPYANANGLKLVPVSIIPVMAFLAKKDAYACELASVHAADVFASIGKNIRFSGAPASSGASIVGDDIKKTVSDAAKKGTEEAKKAAESAKKAAQDFLESDEWAETKKVAKEGAETAKKAAQEAFDMAAPKIAGGVSRAAQNGILVKIIAGVAAAAVVTYGVRAITNHGRDNDVASGIEETQESKSGTTDSGDEYGTDFSGNNELFATDEYTNDENTYVMEDGTAFHLVTSLDSVSDDVLNELGEAHKSCIEGQYQGVTLGSLSYGLNSEIEYIGSYLMTMEQEGKAKNIIIPVYRVGLQSEIFDGTIYLYRQENLNGFYVSDNAMYDNETNLFIADSFDNGRNFVSHFDDDYEVEGDAYTPGIFAFQTRNRGDKVVDMVYLWGFESPLGLEEAIMRDMIWTDAENKHLEANLDVNDLEAHEYHTSDTHQISIDIKEIATTNDTVDPVVREYEPFPDNGN